MDKEKYINELAIKLNLDKKYARKVADLLEDNFIIGKKNKEKTIKHLVEELNITEEEADNIYNVSSSIIVGEIKKEIVITGYDIAYYVSILTILGSIVLAIFQFINKTNEWDKVFMFFILGFIGYYTNKENRKKNK